MRHAGIHWPTGGENPSREVIYAMPGVRHGGLVMLADSARFWYDEARRKSPLVLWRGLPRIHALPALLNWNPVRVADEVLNLWNEQPHFGTEYFIPLNELQFPFESGHNEFPGFGFIAEKLGLLRVELRKRLPAGVKLVWPAWGPDQPYLDAPFDAMGEWINEASHWDVISAHVYSHNDGEPEHFGAANVKRTHWIYRDYFHSQPIVYTEWNANHTQATEREMLEAMAEICHLDPNCLGFMYYIWQTQREGERQLSIWGYPARYELFSNPPALPEPEPLPMYRLPNHVPSTEEIFSYVEEFAPPLGISVELATALLIAESGYNFDKLARWNRWTNEAETAIARGDWVTLDDVLQRIRNLNSDDISFGPAHQAYRWSQEYDQASHPAFRYNLSRIMDFRALYIENPKHAVATALQLLSHYVGIYGEGIEALCRYNRPSTSAANNPNRANYENALSLAPQRIAELRPEPPEDDMPEYHFGFKDLADQLGMDVVGDPLTEEKQLQGIVQFTEKGMMVYDPESNKPYFFEAARPE